MKKVVKSFVAPEVHVTHYKIQDTLIMCMHDASKHVKLHQLFHP